MASPYNVPPCLSRAILPDELKVKLHSYLIEAPSEEKPRYAILENAGDHHKDQHYLVIGTPPNDIPLGIMVDETLRFIGWNSKNLFGIVLHRNWRGRKEATYTKLYTPEDLGTIVKVENTMIGGIRISGTLKTYVVTRENLEAFHLTGAETNTAADLYEDISSEGQINAQKRKLLASIFSADIESVGAQPVLVDPAPKPIAKPAPAILGVKTVENPPEELAMAARLIPQQFTRSNQLLRDLEKTATAARQIIALAVRKHGLTGKQALVLCHLAGRSDILPLADLISETGIDPGETSRVISKLQTDKLIKRSSLKRGRALAIELTPLGKTKADQVNPDFEHALETIEQSLDDTEYFQKNCRQIINAVPKEMAALEVA